MRRLLTIAAVAMVLAGCASYTAGVGTSVVSATDMPNKLVQPNNPLLNRRLTFEHAGLNTLDDGRKEAFITLRSTYKYDQTLQYRFYWYATNGQQLAVTSWQPVMLHGDESRQLQSVAPSQKAKAFRVYVRQAN